MKLAFVLATILVLMGAVTLVNSQCGYCPSYSQPVCGSNYITYPNRCYLSCARVQLAYLGACRGGYSNNLYSPSIYMG